MSPTYSFKDAFWIIFSFLKNKFTMNIRPRRLCSNDIENLNVYHYVRPIGTAPLCYLLIFEIQFKYQLPFLRRWDPTTCSTLLSLQIAHTSNTVMLCSITPFSMFMPTLRTNSHILLSIQLHRSPLHSIRIG